MAPEKKAREAETETVEVVLVEMVVLFVPFALEEDDHLEEDEDEEDTRWPVIVAEEKQSDTIGYKRLFFLPFLPAQLLLPPLSFDRPASHFRIETKV